MHRNIDHLFALATPAAALDPMQANRGVLQDLEGGFTTRLGGPPVFPWNSGVLVLSPSRRAPRPCRPPASLCDSHPVRSRTE